MRAARGAHVLLLNNDVVLTPSWLAGLLEQAASDPRIGVVGPRTNYAGARSR